MFEKLLQKILKDVVGQFIDGIDTKKLNIGIWSGTVQIVNVSLKPKLLAMLGLPYIITFSNISRLFITIPWKNLFTAPLVIQIDSVLILAQNNVYQLSKQQQSKIVLLKIKQFIQKLARQLAKTQKTQEKSAGYLDNVYLKMLDNLYLTIRNIHFRFEVPRPLKYEPDATSFSFGITLQLIELFSVDDKGNRVFIDRTKLSSDKNIIFKKLKLQNFGFYWNFEQKQIIFLSSPSQKQKKQDKYYRQMLDLRQVNAGKGLGKQKMNYVILINAEGLIKEENLQGKNSNKYTKYEVSFSIKQVKMILNENIVKQFVWLMKQISFISANKNNFIPPQFTGQWEGPRNQNCLGLLRKYCINQFWQSQNPKTNSGLTGPEEKTLMDFLYENRYNMDLIKLKMKQIIVGDIGNKNVINKNSMVSNWQSIEDLMNQQKNMEGLLELKFNFNLQQICLFYVDDVKMPIAQLFLRSFIITADQNIQKDLILTIEIGKLEGFGYDQNPIIRMEHQIQVTNKGPKINKISKFFLMMYKSKLQGKMQQIQIDMGGIGFIYDFKTFRQLYKLPQGLISSQTPPIPISPPSNNPQKLILNESTPQNKKSNQAMLIRNTTKEKVDRQCQITITIDNISLYIQQYTKITWRLSLSQCQLTNSQSFIPENIQIQALSLSVSDFFVLQPFGSKIVLNLRNQLPEISIIVEPVLVKIGSEEIKNLLKIPSSLQTYKKNDAISLSSKYGELFLLYDQEVWKKYDGVVIDGYLYLYEKSQQYSKYQLRVIDAVKKQNNKRQTIQITIKAKDGKSTQKLILIVKNASQYNEWFNYLSELAESNKKLLSKYDVKAKANKNQTIKAVKKSKPKLNFCVIFTQLGFFMISKKQKLFGLVLKKTMIQYGEQYIIEPQINLNQMTQAPTLRNKQSSAKSKTKQLNQQIFQSFKQINLIDKFTKVSQQATQNKTFNKQQSKQINQQKCDQKVIIEINNIEFWYKNQRRLRCVGDSPSTLQQQNKLEKSIQITITIQPNSTNIQVFINNKIVLNYSPYQIIQLLSYLSNQIFNLFTPTLIRTKPDSIDLQVKPEQVELVTTNKRIINFSLQIKNSCEINCLNMPTYKKFIKNKQQKEDNNRKILSLSAKTLNLTFDKSGIKLSTADLQAIWYANDTQKYTLASISGKNNKLIVEVANSKLNVNVYGLYLPNYKHYLIMRAIDYLLGNLKQLFLYTYNFNEYYDEFAEGTKNIHTKMFRFKQYAENKLTQSQIWKRIKSLLQLQINIYQGIIGIQQIGYLTVGLVRVTNKYVQSYNHSIRDNILCDQYLIQLKDVNIKIISQSPQQKDKDKQKIVENLEKKQGQLFKKFSKQIFKGNQNLIREGVSKVNMKGKQQERFYTVLNRFSNSINEQEWIQRAKLKTFQIIDSEWPFDMSISIIMFSKFCFYKTLFPKFQLSNSNSTMRIKLKLSELHINLLPHQINMLSQFVNVLLKNLSYSDGNSYEYSYDQQVLKQVYRQQMEKNKKSALQLDEKGIAIITVPIQEILKEDEYINSPIQFNLQVNKVMVSAIIFDNLLINKQKLEQPKSGVRLTEKSGIQPKQYNTRLTGIQIYMENFLINYNQYPQAQTSIMFNLLQLNHLYHGAKINVIEFSSASQRISRQTMFIDSSYKKYTNLTDTKTKVQRITPQINNQQIKQQEQKDKKNHSPQSFIMKMSVKKKLKKSMQNKMVQQNSSQQYQNVKCLDLIFHNIVIVYDINTITSLFKLITALKTEKNVQKKEKIEQKIQSNSNISIKTVLNCQVMSFMLKLPSKYQSPIRKNLSNNFHQSKNIEEDYNICIVLKFLIQSQVPQFMPISLECNYLQIYTQEMNEPQNNDQLTPLKKSKVYNIENQYSDGIHKMKRKTLIQPTKVILRKRIIQKIVEVKKKIKQDQPPLMASRIKSLLNLSSAGNTQQKNINKQQTQRVNQILQEIYIDKCFVKISIQDLQKLGKLLKNVSVELSQINKDIQSLQNLLKKNEILTEFSKKMSTEQKIDPEKQKKMQISKSLQNILKPKVKNQLTLVQSKQKIPQQIQKIANKIQFKPLQIIIMNDNSSTSIPLIYCKMQISDCEEEAFNLQLTANYFNLRINAWQPLIEKNIFVIKMSPHLSIEKLKQQKQKQQEQKQKKQIQKKNQINPQSQNQKLNDFLHINISTNFMEVLIPALRSNESQNLSIKRYSENKSAGDDVNCWMLVNQLGYDITCESKSFRGSKMVTTLSIPNNKSKKLTFLNDLFDSEGFQSVFNNQNQDQISKIMIFGQNQKKSRFTISIIINNQIKIKDIDIGETGVKKLCFNYEGNSFWIYSHTFMDISKNVKYVKFCSQIIIKNLTDVDIWIKLPYKQRIGSENKKQEQIIIPLKKEKSEQKSRKYSHNIDIFKDRREFNQFLDIQSFRNKNKSDHNQLSEKSDEQRLEASFQKINQSRPEFVRIPAKKQLSLAFDIDENFKKINQSDFSQLLSKQVQEGIQKNKETQQKQENYQKIKKKQQFQILKQRKKMRTIFRIQSTGKIINKLPQTINLALKSQDHIFYSFTMHQDQSQFIYIPFNQLEIAIHTDGFQWSNFIPFNVIESIALFDFNKNKLNVKINMFVDQDGITTVIFYPVAVFYNDSDYVIRIRDPDSKNYTCNNVLPKKSVSLSNSRILVLKPDLSVQTGFSSKKTSFTKIYMNQQDQITCKFEIDSINRSLNERQLEHIPPTAIQALVINQISLKTTSGNNQSTLLTNQLISTKFVTISHKYYFINQTQYIVLIRKFTGSDNSSRSKFTNFSVRQYHPFSSQSFWLFEQDASTANQNLTYYELTIKNSPYQWSGALSITKPGNNHFILRNRAHFNDVIFLNLVVIKYHKIQKFKIELNIVQKDQIPFKIKNSLTGFLIKFPEYGNIILKEGQQVDYSWDQPILKGKSIPILLSQNQQGSFDRINYTRFQIKTQSNENQIIKIRKYPQMGQINIIQNSFTKIFQIRQYLKMERKTQKLQTEIQIPLRISIINNSFTPVYHLCDISTQASFKISKVYDATIVNLNLNSIQLDNQTRYRVYFPVVLSTSLSINANIGKNIQLELLTQPIILNVQQDFGKDLYATAMLIASLGSEKKEGSMSRLQNEAETSKIIISKLKLPEVIIKLQVKTKKLSIETSIHLERPAVTKFPWPSFPYPIKNIAINLLSHLSISPWALISSFQKGVVSLLTEQQSTKGIQGFFGQIIAALSNSVSGLAGILVGHDIERVDNFFDGIEQGTNLLVHEIKQIKDCFQPQQCTIPSILKSVGYGIISIVLKPMKGVLQLTLKISQGIKKTALYRFDQSQNRYRQRDLIVFYGQEQKFRTYDANQSQLMVMLLKVCGQPLKYFHLVKFYVIDNKLTNSKSILCIGTEQVILFSVRTLKLTWQINLHEVSQIQIIRYSSIKFSPFDYEVDAFHQDLAQQIYNTLIKVQKKVFIRA